MKVSVIVPVWNGYPYLAPCLNALLSQNYPDLEVIAVDDASEDESTTLIAGRYPTVRLISMARNRGFAAACNVGLQAAHGSLLVLLNQDAEVQPGWLDALVACHQEQGMIGVAGSKAFYPDGRLQHAGGYVDCRGETGHVGNGEADVGQYDELRDPDFVTGASFAISRTALDRTGLLDEGFGAGYYEDVDWCYRVRAAGFRAVYEPRSALVHSEASLLARGDYGSMLRYQRNRLRFVLKHWSVEKLIDEFLPAEIAWLEELGEGAETLVAAARGSYAHHLLHWSEIAALRTGFYEESADQLDVPVRVLMTLRGHMPWRGSLNARPSSAIQVRESHHRLVVGSSTDPRTPMTKGQASARSTLLSRLRDVSSGFIALLRRAKLIFSGKQELLDNWVVDTLDSLSYTQRRMPEVLTALISQNAREIDALTCEISRLRNLIESLEAERKASGDAGSGD